MSKDMLIKDFRFWRYLINAWSVLFFAVVVLDLITNNACVELLNVMSMIYISILAIYVSNKEFERWYNRHNAQHPGEVFVIIWSILMFVLIIFSLLLKNSYQIPAAVISSYIAVLTILAVTRKSKQIYQARHSGKKKKS